jgi:hypothetical protein
MAELTWHYTQQTKRQHFIIDNKMYETFDGGQNIKKYVDGVYITTLRQYPHLPIDFVYKVEDGITPPDMLPSTDQWADEMLELIEQYPDELGEFLPIKEYRQQDGSIKTYEHTLGVGVNNLTDKIRINRMGIPDSIQENWDYELLVSWDNAVLNSPTGIHWKRHKDNGEIIRTPAGNSFPCHVFPEVHPTEVLASKEDLITDIVKWSGTPKDFFVEPINFTKIPSNLFITPQYNKFMEE